MADPRPSPTPGQRWQVCEVCGNSGWVEEESLSAKMDCHDAEQIARALDACGYTDAAVTLRQDSLSSSSLTTKKLNKKLAEMTLHDDTGDPVDEGYMAAVNELTEWLARLACSAGRETPE